MKVKQQLTRKYYKYITVESSWTQPILSSNGTIGVDDFAVTASVYPSRIWRACNPNYDGYWAGGIGQNITFYSNTAICIKRLGLTGYYVNPKAMYISNFNLQGSNDGNSWTDLGNYSNNTNNFHYIEINNNNNFYKYYKITVNSIYTSGAISYIQLIATQQTTSIAEGTKDDYDFYKDKIALSAFIVNNVYKATKF